MVLPEIGDRKKCLAHVANPPLRVCAPPGQIPRETADEDELVLLYLNLFTAAIAKPDNVVVSTYNRYKTRHFFQKSLWYPKIFMCRLLSEKCAFTMCYGGYGKRMNRQAS